MEQRVPLVYLHALMPGKYLAAWPVFVIGEERRSLTFIVALDDKQHVIPAQSDGDEAEYRPRYITASFRVRIHQRSFRVRVLEAYRTQVRSAAWGMRSYLMLPILSPTATLKASPW